MSGEWTEFRPCTDGECSKLQQVLGIGVQYQPLSVSTQVVNGTNYCFYCHGTVISPASPAKPFKIYAYQPQGSQKFDPNQIEIEELPIKP